MESENDKTWDFDPWAERYDAVVANDTRHYYAKYDNVLDAVVEFADLGSGKCVLDIGTGTGSLAIRCLGRGAYVVGLDPSASMLAVAREKIGPHSNVEFVQCPEPFLRTPYPDASFDAVVSTYAYHHIPHRLKAESVCEMLRVLKTGGRWVVGDLAFENEAAEIRALRELGWLEEEYFTRIDDLSQIFAEFDIALQAHQFTPVTWVLTATKNV
ncbi:MAG: methyltransferase domain-containing protein [Anaerolineae bacterium]|nr:methyltransferase domain-containing protein [Anaerolineae bacterium]